MPTLLYYERSFLMGNITIKDALRKSMQATKQYIDKTDDFIFAELIESQNHLKATNSQMATNLLELGNPLYQQQLAEEGKAGRFCFNIENDISDYYTGTFMHILFLDSNDKAVLYRTGRTANDSNMQISISNGVLPSGAIFNGTCRLTKNKIFDENMTLVSSEGQSSAYLSISAAYNTEAIVNELQTLKIKILLVKPNFLTFDNKNEFVPTSNYHPATKKYVDDHFITDIYEDALVITAEEMNSSNNGGRGIYIDKIKTLDPAGFNVDFIYYGYYKDAVAVLTYSTQFNMFYCNSMDKNGSQSIAICMGAGDGNLIPMNNGTQDVKDYQFTEDLIIKKRILLGPNTTATKGYVDDTVMQAGTYTTDLTFYFDHGYESSSIGYVNVFDFEPGKRYKLPKQNSIGAMSKAPLCAINDDDSLFTIDDGSNTIGFTNLHDATITVMYKASNNSQIILNFINSIMQVMINVVKTDGKYSATFTASDVTQDYHRANKKYVDDAIAAGGVDTSSFAPIDSPNFINSISMGRDENEEIGWHSVALGNSTVASGGTAFASGSNTYATGWGSHTEGYYTHADGDYSHAEGQETHATEEMSHAEGYYTYATGRMSHAEGCNTQAEGLCAHAEGEGTLASGARSHAEGFKTAAVGYYAHAEGSSFNNAKTIMSNLYDTTDNDTIITAWQSNSFTLAKGEGAHAEGCNTLALGNYSHAEGAETTASGIASHAKGYHTTASGDGSYAEGYYTEASGLYSHAEGYGTIASETNSHVEGFGTVASSEYQHVQGKFNIEDSANTYAHIVGNGDANTRSNAHTLDWDGNAWFAGNITIGTDNKQLATINDTQINAGELDAYLNGIFTENRSVEEIAACMYYVEDVEGAPYNFVINEDGFYESTNQGVNSSYSMCKVTIVNTIGAEVVFDCINSSQSAYDFGILSNVGQELAMNASTDANYKYLFMSESSLDVKSINYGNVSGVIYVKYKKDSSGFGGNDSLQFKVRFNKPL